MLPQLIQIALKKWFAFPDNPVHAQVATITVDKALPHVRTMVLIDITLEGYLVFSSRTDTLKWTDLQQNPQASVCFVNSTFGQLIAEGSVTLNTKGSSLIRQGYWDNLPRQIQNIYLFDAKEVPSTPPRMPEVFGIIQIEPMFWEILSLNTNEFIKSSRIGYQLVKESWHPCPLNPV